MLTKSEIESDPGLIEVAERMKQLRQPVVSANSPWNTHEEEVAAEEERKRRRLVETESTPGADLSHGGLRTGGEWMERDSVEVFVQRPEPVYCCERMRTAIDAGAIDTTELPAIVKAGDSWFGTQPDIWPINFCPFCGAAVGSGTE